MHLTGIAFTLLLFAYSSSSSAQTLTQPRPLCLSSASDVDGDGFGWEFNRTCVVNAGAGSTATQSAASEITECVDPDGDGFGWNGVATCTVQAMPLVTTQSGSTAGITECIDADGDGFGWNGVATCTVQTTPFVTTQSGSSAAITECMDPDGDGFGWNGIATCTVQAIPVVTTQSGSIAAPTECIDPDGDGFGWNGVATCRVGSLSSVTTQSGVAGITDVVLMMGQSNALGENTNVQQASLDSSNNNIIVWTQFDGWQVADLCTQIWQKGWFPWRGGVCSNHPAFQIAKGIVAADPSRRVAIIPTGIAGKPISWWDPGGVAYVLAKAHVEAALAELPGISQVSLVAWSQGEADSGSENNWFNKLNNLISRLRNESWVNASSTVFIAQETKSSSVNTRLPSFDNDGDALTNWIPAADLSTKDGVHWSGAALRTLGSRYASRYLSVTGR